MSLPESLRDGSSKPSSPVAAQPSQDLQRPRSTDERPPRQPLPSSPASSLEVVSPPPLRPSPSLSYTPYKSSRNGETSYSSDMLAPSPTRQTPSGQPSPRIMQQSDSMTSFETPPRNQTPSPYIPEQDAARDELMGVLSALRACDATDMTSKLYLGAQLHRLLIESEAPTQACNDFREAAGFLIIVQTFSALGQTVYKNEQDTQEDDHSNERLRR